MLKPQHNARGLLEATLLARVRILLTKLGLLLLLRNALVLAVLVCSLQRRLDLAFKSAAIAQVRVRSLCGVQALAIELTFGKMCLDQFFSLLFNLCLSLLFRFQI